MLWHSEVAGIARAWKLRHMMMSSREALSKGLRALMDDRNLSQRAVEEMVKARTGEEGDAKRTIRQRTIGNVLSPGGHSPTLAVIESIAASFGVEAWELLIPGQDAKTLRRGEVRKLVSGYLSCDEPGRADIRKAVEKEIMLSGRKSAAA